MGKKEKKPDSAPTTEISKKEPPVEKLDLSGLSESLRAPSKEKVVEALGQVLDLTFDEKYVLSMIAHCSGMHPIHY